MWTVRGAAVAEVKNLDEVAISSLLRTLLQSGPGIFHTPQHRLPQSLEALYIGHRQRTTWWRRRRRSLYIWGIAPASVQYEARTVPLILGFFPVALAYVRIAGTLAERSRPRRRECGTVSLVHVWRRTGPVRPGPASCGR